MLKQTNIPVKLSKYNALAKTAIRSTVARDLRRRGCTQEFIDEFLEKTSQIRDKDEMIAECKKVCLLTLPKKETGWA